jgi:hypothetical protein
VIRALSALVEALAFSSVLAAGVAGALTLAAGFSLVDHKLPLAAALAFAGTLVVYNVDRLRDLDRDMLASPRRSAFVRAHRSPIVGLVVVAAACCCLLAWRVGAPSVALCAALLLPSLFHRRIKHHPAVKASYVTAAWVAATVGLAALSALDHDFGQGGEATRFWGVVGWVAAIYGAAIGANLVASNAQDFGNLAGRRVSTWGARGLAAAGVMIALAGPEATRPLLWIPLCQLAGVLHTADCERARLLRVDGLLLLGALVPLSFRVATWISMRTCSQLW